MSTRVMLAAALLSTTIFVALLVDPAQASAQATSPTPTRTPTPVAAPIQLAPLRASEVLRTAQQYVGVPYVYGGFSPNGFDCSGYVSRIWNISPRRTTDTMSAVTRTIAKDELLPGDALNYPLAGKVGHIRIFDKWATADKALVWVYEATEPQVMHHVVPYDPRYIPARRLNIVSDVPMPPPPPLPADWNKPPARRAPTVAPKPPGALAGRLINEASGAPLARARVFYWTESEQYKVDSVLTDADGKFTIDKLVVGDYELAAYANGFDVEFRGDVGVRSSATTKVELKLAPAAGAVSGQRLDTGTPSGGDQPAKNVAPTVEPPTALPLDHEIPGGRFFTQTAGRDGITGYAVTDEGGIKFWSEFQRLGGVQALGYPVSRRFQKDGFTVQAMQKGVLQWRPEVRQAWLTNVFDEMHDTGKDDWLMVRRSTPRPIDAAEDNGKTWAQIVARRLAFLDPREVIEKRYDSVADPMTFFGLPTSRIEDMGNHYAVRLQRAVIQLWKVDVPWAKAGETTVANGGDVAKEAGLFPSAAVQPQRSPLIQANRFTGSI